MQSSRWRILATFAAAALLLQHCSDGPEKAKLTPEQVEEVCIHIVSCQHADNPASTERVSECVNDLMWMGMAEMGVVDYGDVIGCIKDAGSDCEALWRCSNEGHPPEACDVSTYDDHCEGRMQVACSEGTITYFDCSRLDGLYAGATCVEDPDTGEPDCEGTATCDSSHPTNCTGSTLELCIDGELMRMDCSLIGARCTQVMPGVDYCVGRGEACTTEDTAWCEGTSVVRCLGGHEAHMDCAAQLGVEFTCFASDGDAECGPRGTQCDGETHIDTCSGATIEYCRWGLLDNANCTLMGYSTCTEGTDSAFCE